MRGRAGSVAASPTLVGAVTVLVVVVAVFLAYQANQGLPFVPTYKLSAELPNAETLVPGNDVRIGGARVVPVQLVLAGGGATDDPEGEQVLKEVREFAGDDPDCHILVLPPDAHRQINALQRASDIIIQKSLKEGFGLTVTEGLWKGKPVIAGDTGGIKLQVIDHFSGFRVNTPEGAALRIRYLLKHPELMESMGKNAHKFVQDNFLITRHLREYLTLVDAIIFGSEDKIELKVQKEPAMNNG
jgi:glycosyltransferase involved in cell wall biosynthesis